MSVLVSDRNESRIEAVIFPNDIHDMVINLMHRNFGVKDMKKLARSRYLHSLDPTENIAKYRALMHECKVRIENAAAMIETNTKRAYYLYPSSMHEYEKRRDYQNMAICDCEVLKKELQRVVAIFCVDINIFGPLIKAINREIGLIKKWRQRENKMKSYLK